MWFFIGKAKMSDWLSHSEGINCGFFFIKSTHRHTRSSVHNQCSKLYIEGSSKSPWTYIRHCHPSSSVTWWNFCSWHSAEKLCLVKVGAEILHDDNGKLGLQSGEKNGIGVICSPGMKCSWQAVSTTLAGNVYCFDHDGESGRQLREPKISTGLRLLECSCQRWLTLTNTRRSICKSRRPC